jgi:broad specificity phosphatase PhoE
VADPPVGVTDSGLRLPPHLNATLVLVRHGESTWIAEGRFQGRLDPPLSALGRRQAGLVAERLAERDEQTPLPIPAGRPAGIWHSPLTRAADTARAIRDRQPSPPPLHPSDGLTEIAQGEWEGVHHSEVSSRWAEQLARWRRTPATEHAPGGEALPAAARRVAGALGEIAESLVAVGAITDRPASDAPDRAVADGYSPVPGYPSPAPPDGAPLEPWAIVVAHDGIFRLALMSLIGLDLERFWSFPFNLCGITVVGLHEGVAALRAHNLSEHLAPLAAEARAAEEARGERRGAL